MNLMVMKHGFLDDGGDRPRTARERRIARAKDKAHVRLALSSTAPFGYYVFDEIITEDAGLLDFLAVGPLGVVVIPVRSDEGRVSRGGRGHKILLDGEPFDDDPLSQAEELCEELHPRLFEQDGYIGSLICFPRASFEVDDERRPPPGTTPVWELSWALDPTGQEDKLSPAQIEEIANRVREIYGRPPIVVPKREDRERS